MIIVKEIPNGWHIILKKYTVEIITAGVKRGTWSVLPVRQSGPGPNAVQTLMQSQLSSASDWIAASQTILDIIVKNGRDIETKRFNKILLDVFQDPTNVRLEKIRFTGPLKIRVSTMYTLFKSHHQFLTEVDFTKCKLEFLTSDIWSLVNSSPCLKTLYVIYLPGPLKCKSLRSLYIKDQSNPTELLYPYYLDYCVNPVIKNLETLSLSGTGCSGCKSLKKASSLKTLQFYNCKTESMIKSILGLPKLKVVCISVPKRNFKKFGIYANPEETLNKMIETLPSLCILRFSGTNLTTDREIHDPTTGLVTCEIPALARREKNRLQFLGLYRSEGEASVRYLLPAHKGPRPGQDMESQWMSILEERLNAEPNASLEWCGVLCTLLKSDVEALTNAEIERRLKFLFTLVDKRINGWAGDTGLALQCMNQMYLRCEGLKIGPEAAKKIVNATCVAIQLNPNWPMVQRVSHVLLNKIEFTSDKHAAVACYFEEYAKALMSVNLIKISCSRRILLVRLQNVLTSSNKEGKFAEYLCGWRIIEVDIEHLECYYELMTSNSQLTARDRMQDDINELWRGMSNVMENCPNAVMRFINNSGIQLVKKYLTLCDESTELQEILLKIVEIITTYPEFCEIPKSMKKNSIMEKITGMNEILRDSFSEKAKKKNIKRLATIRTKLWEIATNEPQQYEEKEAIKTN